MQLFCGYLQNLELKSFVGKVLKLWYQIKKIESLEYPFVERTARILEFIEFIDCI